jgi:nitrite reductase/ring-hydroxylating ferredoxin subunit
MGKRHVSSSGTHRAVASRWERIYAIHDRCSHRGCSLRDGTFDGDYVTCGCNGSRFDLRDGSLARGPATAPQPSFQVREREGIIEIRRLSAGLS